MPVNGPQPFFRMNKKRKRRHYDKLTTIIEAAQPGADQSHIMIERQPAYKYILGICLNAFSHGADIGQEIGVGKNYTFGIACTAGCVLQKRSIRRPYQLGD